MNIATTLGAINTETLLKYVGTSVFVAIFFLFFGEFESFYVDGTHYLHVNDDHMITLRVARNFYEYGAPFFNQGENVAANTSLFWPIILGSTLMSFSTPDAVSLNIIVSAILSALTIAFAILWLEDWRVRLSAIILLIFSATFLHYGVSGWEHIPQSFLVTAGFFLIYKRSKKKLTIPTSAVVLVSLSFLFRPDSAVIVAITVLFWFFVAENYKRWSTYLISIALLIMPISYLLLMSHFYDSLIPNTAVLKSLGFFESVLAGFSYVTNPLRSGFVPALLLLLLCVRGKSDFSKFVCCVGLGHLAYVIFAGGDVFMSGRFFMLLLPSLVFTIASEIDNVKRIFNKERLGNLALSFCICIAVVDNRNLFLSHAFSLSGLPSSVEQQVRVIHEIGEKLKPTDGSIGLHWLGVAYHAPQFHVVDFLGKAEPYIARTEIKYGPVGHNRWDYSYALQNYNLAVIPHDDNTVMRVSSENFSPEEKDFMFWEEAARSIIDTGNYTYVPAEYFGNLSFGAFVRDDLVQHFN